MGTSTSLTDRVAKGWLCPPSDLRVAVVLRAASVPRRRFRERRQPHILHCRLIQSHPWSWIKVHRSHVHAAPDESAMGDRARRKHSGGAEVGGTAGDRRGKRKSSRRGVWRGVWGRKGRRAVG